MSTVDIFNSQIYMTIDLKQEDRKLTGKFGNDALEGTVDGNSYHFLAKDENGGTEEVTGRLEGGTLRGDVIETPGSDPKHPFRYTFTATLVKTRSTAPPATA